jgi:hypothetical protein
MSFRSFSLTARRQILWGEPAGSPPPRPDDPAAGDLMPHPRNLAQKANSEIFDKFGPASGAEVYHA